MSSETSQIYDKGGVYTTSQKSLNEVETSSKEALGKRHKLELWEETLRQYLLEAVKT